MRRTLYILIFVAFLGFSFQGSLAASSRLAATADSLKKEFQSCTDSATRISLLIDLSDIVPLQQDATYAEQLLKEARATHNIDLLTLILPKLAWWEMWQHNIDQVDAYCNEMRNSLPEELGKPLALMVEMKQEEVIINDCDDAMCDALIRRTIGNLGQNNEDIYLRIHKIHTIIVATKRLAHLLPYKADEYYQEVLKYEQSFFELISRCPSNYGTDALRQMALSDLSSNPTLKPKEKERYMDLRIELLEKYYNRPEIKYRRWYTQATRVAAYSDLLTLTTVEPEEREKYWRECLRLIDANPSAAPLGDPVYSKARITTLYYGLINRLTPSQRAQYAKALEQCIELGSLAETITDRHELARLYRELGRYDDSTLIIEEMMSLVDSLHSATNEVLATQLMAQYELVVHDLESSDLRSQNMRNIIICGAIITLLLLGWGIYNQRVNLKFKRMNRRLLETERMKTAFIRSMCHEVRTPLNIISGFSQMIAKDNISPRTKSRMVEDIEKQTNFLTDTLDDLLSVAQLDSSDQLLPLKPGNVKPELEKLVEKYHEMRPEATFNLNCEMVPVVNTNMPYLTKAIETLLANVAKHCPTDVHCCLNCTYEEGFLYIACEDNGPGIPIEKRESVFQRFTKLNEFVQGTGLGLYLCRLVMERLNGTVKIDAEYQNGTRMILKIPAVSVNQGDIIDPKSEARSADVSFATAGGEQ